VMVGVEESSKKPYLLIEKTQSSDKGRNSQVEKREDQAILFHLQDQKPDEQV